LLVKCVKLPCKSRKKRVFCTWCQIFIILKSSKVYGLLKKEGFLEHPVGYKYVIKMCTGCSKSLYSPKDIRHTKESTDFWDALFILNTFHQRLSWAS
jgi:RNase P subunit RPR2